MFTVSDWINIQVYSFSVFKYCFEVIGYSFCSNACILIGFQYIVILSLGVLSERNFDKISIINQFHPSKKNQRIRIKNVQMSQQNP